MKKSLTIVLCLVLCLVFIAACKGKTSENIDGSLEEAEVSDGVNREVILDYIVKAGVTEYQVVYPEVATSAEIYAASELVNFVSESTGANLAMIPDTNVKSGTNGKYISIGQTDLFMDSAISVDYDELNADGFIVKSAGKTMYVEGASQRGILYGVYDFLEKVIGVRFIASDVTHVPAMNDLPLYEMNIQEAPAFAYRNLYSYSMRTDDVLYTRLRFNAPERAISEMYGGRTDWYTKLNDIVPKYDSLKSYYPHYPEFNVIHNAYYYVSPAEYYDDYPEFFAVDESGNTIRDQQGTICQLNLLNGMTDEGELDQSMDVSVAKVALESLKAFILDDPDAKVFFFGHNDWNVYDKSSRTKAAEALYGGQSGILMRFVNMLSREINKWMNENNMDREVTIATWAYLFTKEAPVVSDGQGGWKAVHESVIPEKNVSVRMAPIELDWYYSVTDPNQIEEYGNLVTQWTYLTRNTMIWTYETDFGNYLAYYPSMRQWADNIRYFREIGVEYLMMQDNYHGFGSWQAEMHTYVAAKMMWNPDLKTQPLIDEFLYYYFGEECAKSVKSMMNLFDDHFALLQAEKEDFWVPFRDDDGTTLKNPDNFPIELLENAMRIVQEAIAYNRNDQSVTARERNARDRRLTSVLLTPQVMILKNYTAYYKSGRMAFASEFFKNADYVGVLDLSEVQSLIQYKAEFNIS